MVTRVATSMSREILTARMTELQARLQETGMQVFSEKKSQTYSGIASDSFRLISFENQRDRIQRYKSANSVAEVRLESMNTAVTSVRDTVLELRRKVLELSQQGISGNDEDSVKALEEMQKRAFSTMQDIQYYLNTNADSRYVFSGGKTDTPPVALPYGSLTAFQAAYDGNDVTFPTTQAANLFDVTFAGMDITAANVDVEPVDTVDDHGQLTATGTNDFVTRTLSNAEMGSLTLNSAGTLRSVNEGVFSTLTRGATLLLDDGTAAAGNQQAYTVTDITADGRQITVTPPPASTETLANAKLHLTVPDGTKITIQGTSGINGEYTVDYPTPWPGAATDGTVLYVKPQLPATGALPAGSVSVKAQSYYQGDDLQSSHRVDDHRAIDFGINAKDPAFEKAFRALGILAQGAPTTDGAPLQSSGANFDSAAMEARITEALTLLNDSLEHRPTTAEDASDLDSLARQIASNHNLLSAVNTQHTESIAYLEIRMSDMENVNMTEAVTRLQDDSRALEISYATMSRVMSLSLHNYI